MKKLIFLIFIAFALSISLLACKPQPVDVQPAAFINTPPAEPTNEPTMILPPIAMANPAAIFCVINGWVSDVRDEEGGQVGYCILDDQTECEEWALMRGACGPLVRADDVPPDVIAARDAAFAYVGGQYAPPAFWDAKMLQTEMVGSAMYNFVGESWMAAVRYPITAPDQVIYEVTIANLTGKVWQLSIDASGSITLIGETP